MKLLSTGAAARLAVAWLAGAVALFAGAAPDDAGQRSGARWYEVELPAPGEEPLLPIATDALAELLSAHGYDGVVLRLPSDDPRVAARPVATQLDLADATATAPFEELLAPWRARSLAVAVGARESTQIAELPPWPAIEPLALPDAAGATVVLEAARRPAVLHYGWQSLAAPRADARLLVSSRLLLPTVAPLRAAQLRRDVASFGRRGPDGDDRLLRHQSALLSAVAERLGGDHPELVAPFENQASAAVGDSSRMARRRAPAWLDLEEWLFSWSARGELLFATLPWDVTGRAQDDAAAQLDPFGDPIAAGAPESSDAAPSRPGDGVLSHEELAAIRQRLAARFVAAAKRGSDWSGVAIAGLDATRDANADVASGAPPLPTAAADAWSSGAAIDAEQQRADPVGEHWRLRSHTWRWSSPASRLHALQARPLVATAADDARLVPFEGEVERALGGGRRELGELIRVAPRAAFRCSTTLSLRDPTCARLRLDCAADRTVRVNGSVVVDRFAAGRGPLLATLSLPAGTSELTLDLELDGSSGDFLVTLDFVPQRAEGNVLTAARASKVREPVVRLGDPGAFEQVSLTRLPGRTVSGDGDAFLPFKIGDPDRFDLWLHLLAPAERAARLDLRIDEGIVREVPMAPRATWQWVRLAAPLALDRGDHSVQLLFPIEGVRFDEAVLLRSALTVSRHPDGRKAWWEQAWRFDPLGAGVVIDLPTPRPGDLFGRAFELEKSGSYQLYAWLKGTDPLAHGQRAEVELTSPSTKVRLVLPAGTPCEEWVALGEVSIAAGERVEVRVRGDGALARVALVR